jgi:hypothetical protein
MLSVSSLQTVENRLELREAGLKQEGPRAAIALGSDEVKARLPRGEIGW